MAFVRLAFARQHNENKEFNVTKAISHSATISLSELKLHDKSKTFDYQDSARTIKLGIIQLLKEFRLLPLDFEWEEETFLFAHPATHCLLRGDVLSELIKNWWDADAEKIKLTIQILGDLATYTFQDDGTGIQKDGFPMLNKAGELVDAKKIVSENQVGSHKAVSAVKYTREGRLIKGGQGYGLKGILYYNSEDVDFKFGNSKAKNALALDEKRGAIFVISSNSPRRNYQLVEVGAKPSRFSGLCESSSSFMSCRMLEAKGSTSSNTPESLSLRTSPSFTDLPTSMTLSTPTSRSVSVSPSTDSLGSDFKESSACLHLDVPIDDTDAVDDDNITLFKSQLTPLRI
jgi:hypothetical protein